MCSKESKASFNRLEKYDPCLAVGFVFVSLLFLSTLKAGAVWFPQFRARGAEAEAARLEACSVSASLGKLGHGAVISLPLP